MCERLWHIVTDTRAPVYTSPCCPAGLLTAVAWQQAARIVTERMPHLSSAGRMRGVGPLAAATLLQPFARDWGNVAFWWV